MPARGKRDREIVLKEYAGLFRQAERAFTRKQVQKAQRILKGLDLDLIEEKITLVRDTMLEILRNREGSTNRLLQRNVWSSLDVIALQFDHAGFTPLFRELAPKVMRSVHLDDPTVIALEWQLALEFLGVTAHEASTFGYTASDLAEISAFVENKKFGRAGLPEILGPKFSFLQAFARSCGRPDAILEVHRVPGLVAPPKANGWIIIIGLGDILLALGLVRRGKLKDALILLLISLALILLILWILGC